MDTSTLKSVDWGKLFALILVVSLCCISLFAIADVVFEEKTRLDAYGLIWLIFAALNMVIWVIRKNWVSLSFILINLTMAVSYLTDYRGVGIVLPLFLAYAFYFYLIYKNHRMASHYRRILHLSAIQVKNTMDGFTSRPFPAGRHPYTRDDVSRFSRFLKKHWIAIPFEDTKSVLLTIKEQNRFWFSRPGEKENTYIVFSDDGSVFVNIARRDYQKYKSEYSFDELCDSMGVLFKRFLRYHNEGNQEKILEELRGDQNPHLSGHHIENGKFN